MKYTLIIAATMLLVGAASASVAVFRFDPNDLIDNYTAGNPTGEGMISQEDPRFIYDGTFNNVAATYTDDPLHGSRWTGNASYYTDWLAGLSSGEGISRFHMWITTPDYINNAYLRPDMSQDIYRSGNSANGLAGTGWGDWTATVGVGYTSTTWGITHIVEWATTNPDAYLRPGGMDIGEFSFTLGDVFTGSDPDNPEELVDGDYRVWFSGGNSTNGAGVIFDNQGWGTASGETPWAAGNADQWQGEMSVSAEVIPEPASTTLLLIGAAIIGTARLKQRLG
jgi:hypothetical protein